MKLSYNTNTNLTTPLKPIPWFDEWQEAFLAASSRSYKNLITKQTTDYGFPSDLSRRIERRATELADAKNIPALQLLSKTIDKFKPQVDALHAFGIKLSDKAFDISKTTKRLAGISAASLANGTIQELGISNKARELLQLDDSLPSRLKAADPVFWSRRIKKKWRLLESEMNFILQNKEVNTSVKWISPEAKRRHQDALEFSKKYVKKLALVEKNTGETKSAQKIFDSDEADYRRYANYLARAKGIAELAEELGLGLSAMITITLPSRQHPLATCKKTRERIPNPKYRNQTIKESDEKFRHDWKKIRALLAKHDIDITHYFLAAQPHKSGAPHYHLTGFFRNEAHLRAVLQRITQTTDQQWMIDHKDGNFQTVTGITQTKPNIRGVRADIFRNKEGKPDPEGALAYMLASLKYLIPTEKDKKGKKTKRCNEEVRSIKAWATANGIRRFTTSHGHNTLWNLLRKLEDFGSAAQVAAKAGNHAQFFKTLHLIDKNGEVKKHGDEHFDFVKITKQNDYAEQIEVIKGVNFSRVSIADVMQFAGQYRLEKEWEIIKIIQGVTHTQKNQGNPNPNPPTPTLKDENWQYLPPPEPPPPPETEFSEHI